jgi:hypothetical protein
MLSLLLLHLIQPVCPSLFPTDPSFSVVLSLSHLWVFFIQPLVLPLLMLLFCCIPLSFSLVLSLLLVFIAWFQLLCYCIHLLQRATSFVVLSFTPFSSVPLRSVVELVFASRPSLFPSFQPLLFLVVRVPLFIQRSHGVVSAALVFFFVPFLFGRLQPLVFRFPSWYLV